VRTKEQQRTIYPVAVTAVKGIRMETKERNEGSGLHIPGKMRTQNLKTCNHWNILFLRGQKLKK
jgi:hypothetical protein